MGMDNAVTFIADLERHCAGEPVFHPPTPEQDQALDRLFAMMKPCFEAALQEAVDAGILRKREDGE
jgi:hypothetical protein